VDRYERRLPHWDAIGESLFVTFRLRESLSANRMFPQAQLSSGRVFVAADRLLDTARQGPLYLRQPEIASLVTEALAAGDERFHRYQLHAFVVMPNHVHLLVTPRVPFAKWLGPLKGFTAHRANELLSRTGAFWQDESYDRLVRNNEEFERIRTYIENNPVTAGLAASPEEYPWSSAAPGRRNPAGLPPG
jgi:putative DNA methylase